MQSNGKAWQRFIAVVNFNSKLQQHFQDINILMVTSQGEGGGIQVGGARLRCSNNVYEAESKQLSKRV